MWNNPFARNITLGSFRLEEQDSVEKQIYTVHVIASMCYTSRNDGPLIHWCSIFNFIVRSAKAITNVQYRWFTSVLTFCLHCLLPIWFSHHFPSNSIKAAIAEINRLTLSLGPNVCQGC